MHRFTVPCERIHQRFPAALQAVVAQIRQVLRQPCGVSAFWRPQSRSSALSAPYWSEPAPNEASGNATPDPSRLVSSIALWIPLPLLQPDAPATTPPGVLAPACRCRIAGLRTRSAAPCRRRFPSPAPSLQLPSAHSCECRSPLSFASCLPFDQEVAGRAIVRIRTATRLSPPCSEGKRRKDWFNTRVPDQTPLRPQHLQSGYDLCHPRR